MTNDERFEFAVGNVLKHEGGFTNNPLDPGGNTNFGITQSDLNDCYKKLGLPEKVEDLTPDLAKIYYKTMWWELNNYDAIQSPTIAAKIFDTAVNLGEIQVNKLVQKSCNFLCYDLKVDGILGIQSLHALNEISAHGREEDFLMDLVEEQSNFYKLLAEEHPTLQLFLKGWLNRAQWIPVIS